MDEWVHGWIDCALYPSKPVPLRYALLPVSVCLSACRCLFFFTHLIHSVLMVVLRKTFMTAPMWWSTTALPRRPSTREPGILRYAVVMRPSALDDSTHRPSCNDGDDDDGDDDRGGGISVGCAPATPTLPRWWFRPVSDGWGCVSINQSISRSVVGSIDCVVLLFTSR